MFIFNVLQQPVRFFFVCLKLMFDSLKEFFSHVFHLRFGIGSQTILPEDKNRCQQAWVTLKWASRSPVLFPYNIQAPGKKRVFFSVNVILLQTSLWKYHPTTLFISSPALFSIIHHFPSPQSHTQGEALFGAVGSEVWWRDWKDGCSGRSGTLLLRSDVVCSAVITCYWRSAAVSHTALLQRTGGAVNHVCGGFWLVWSGSFKVLVCAQLSEVIFSLCSFWVFTGAQIWFAGEI